MKSYEVGMEWAALCCPGAVRIGLICFQARHCTRRPKLSLVSSYVYFVLYSTFRFIGSCLLLLCLV